MRSSLSTTDSSVSSLSTISSQEFTETLSEVSLLQSGKAVRENPRRIRTSRPAIDRTSPQGEKPAHPAARQSIPRTFSLTYETVTAEPFPTHALYPTQLSDTARRDTRSALARVGITIGRNKCVYVIGRASEGASSLVTPPPVATAAKTTRLRLTCTCVLNAHTRRLGIDRAAREIRVIRGTPGGTHHPDTAAPVGSVPPRRISPHFRRTFYVRVPSATLLDRA